MILFFNVLITNNRNSGPNRVDRLNLFKYTLSSYACIDKITDVIIYAELDGDYKSKEGQLRDYINLIFSDKKVQYYNFSPSIQSEWQKALENSILLTTKEPILYSGNDDHIFTDYELNGLYEGLEMLKQEPQDQINSLHFTSWPESISLIYNFSKRGVPFKHRGLYWESDMLIADAIQIVNSTFFKYVFFELDMGDAFVRRTDKILSGWYPVLGGHRFPAKKEHPKVKRFTPLREMGRHFDSYFHIHLPFSHCPPLTIPDGFFENNIKINYCGERKNEFYNINPTSEKYFIEDKNNGTDDKKMLEDLPLFWRTKISEINDNSSRHSREELLAGRNSAHKAIMTAPHCRHWQTPEHVYNRDILDLEEKYIIVGYRE